jgi:hypothetical protein
MSDVQEEENCIAVIQALKENNNILKTEIVNYKLENKELKEKVKEASKIIKSLRYFLYTAIVIDVIGLVGIIYNEIR